MSVSAQSRMNTRRTTSQNVAKFLGVAIHPRALENDAAENNGFLAQDLVRISNVDDNMYFMNYTEHSISPHPKPPGSISWAQETMNYALTDLAKFQKRKSFLE